MSILTHIAIVFTYVTFYLWMKNRITSKNEKLFFFILFPIVLLTYICSIRIIDPKKLYIFKDQLIRDDIHKEDYMYIKYKKNGDNFIRFMYQYKIFNLNIFARVDSIPFDIKDFDNLIKNDELAQEYKKSMLAVNKFNL